VDNDTKFVIEHVKGLIESLKGETQRGGVLIAAAHLEHQLGQLIAKALRPCPKDDGLLDGANAPIGTFNSRTLLAYRLMLIDDSMKRCLDIVRRIRNDFAHSFSRLTLRDQKYRDLIANAEGLISQSQAFRNVFKQASDDSSDRFIVAFGLMSSVLALREQHQGPIDSGPGAGFDGFD
jgi:hypothetical protein